MCIRDSRSALKTHYNVLLQNDFQDSEECLSAEQSGQVECLTVELLGAIQQNWPIVNNCRSLCSDQTTHREMCDTLRRFEALIISAKSDEFIRSYSSKK